MDNDSISIKKLKEVFALSTGDRTIEVTKAEYDNLLKEAKEMNYPIRKHDESFFLTIDNLTIHVVCELDDDTDYL